MTIPTVNNTVMSCCHNLRWKGSYQEKEEEGLECKKCAKEEESKFRSGNSPHAAASRRVSFWIIKYI